MHTVYNYLKKEMQLEEELKEAYCVPLFSTNLSLQEGLKNTINNDITEPNFERSHHNLYLCVTPSCPVPPLPIFMSNEDMNINEMDAPILLMKPLPPFINDTFATDKNNKRKGKNNPLSSIPPKKNIKRKRNTPDKWTLKENDILHLTIKELQEQGTSLQKIKWKEVAQRVGGTKTGKKCRQRYHRVCLKSEKIWSFDEETILMNGHSNGLSFSELSFSLPGRPDTICSYQHTKILNQMQKWMKEDDINLSQAIKEITSQIINNDEKKGSNKGEEVKVEVNWDLVSTSVGYQPIVCYWKSLESNVDNEKEKERYCI